MNPMIRALMMQLVLTKIINEKDSRVKKEEYKNIVKTLELLNYDMKSYIKDMKTMKKSHYKILIKLRKRTKGEK